MLFNICFSNLVFKYFGPFFIISRGHCGYGILNSLIPVQGDPGPEMGDRTQQVKF